MQSITFSATSKRDLVPLGLPEDKRVTGIDPLLRSSSAFSSVYGHPTHDEYGRAGPPETPPETVTVPNLVLIWGAEDVENVLPTHSGLVGTVATAYGLHHNLVLRPDDVWIAILTQFSAYVNGRAEELRPLFVAHEGKIELEVGGTGSGGTVDFGMMTIKMLDEISENIKDESLREWFLPGFTTSTVKDDVCAAASAMCALQEYFSYEFIIICGIPEVTLMGSTDDWRRLQDKIERLMEFDNEEHVLEEWVGYLRTIAENLVESSMNGSENNLDFWDDIVVHKSVGCGTPVVSGWMSAFSFFNDKGQRIANSMSWYNLTWPAVDIDQLNANVVSCPVKIDDNGVEYNSTLFVGQMAFDAEPAAVEGMPVAVHRSEGAALHEISPRNDWALAISQDFLEEAYSQPDDPPKDFVWRDGESSYSCEAYPQGPVPPPVLPPSEDPGSMPSPVASSKNLSTGAVAGIAISSVFVAVALAVFVFAKMMRSPKHLDGAQEVDQEVVNKAEENSASTGSSQEA